MAFPVPPFNLKADPESVKLPTSASLVEPKAMVPRLRVVSLVMAKVPELVLVNVALSALFVKPTAPGVPAFQLPEVPQSPPAPADQVELAACPESVSRINSRAEEVKVLRVFMEWEVGVGWIEALGITESEWERSHNILSLLFVKGNSPDAIPRSKTNAAQTIDPRFDLRRVRGMTALASRHRAPTSTLRNQHHLAPRSAKPTREPHGVFILPGAIRQSPSARSRSGVLPRSLSFAAIRSSRCSTEAWVRSPSGGVWMT